MTCLMPFFLMAGQRLGRLAFLGRTKKHHQAVSHRVEVQYQIPLMQRPSWTKLLPKTIREEK